MRTAVKNPIGGIVCVALLVFVSITFQAPPLHGAETGTSSSSTVVSNAKVMLTNTATGVATEAFTGDKEHQK
jgi:hypothetical protein